MSVTSSLHECFSVTDDSAVNRRRDGSLPLPPGRRLSVPLPRTRAPASARARTSLGEVPGSASAGRGRFPIMLNGREKTYVSYVNVSLSRHRTTDARLIYSSIASSLDCTANGISAAESPDNAHRRFRDYGWIINCARFLRSFTWSQGDTQNHVAFQNHRGFYFASLGQTDSFLDGIFRPGWVGDGN